MEGSSSKKQRTEHKKHKKHKKHRRDSNSNQHDNIETKSKRNFSQDDHGQHTHQVDRKYQKDDNGSDRRNNYGDSKVRNSSNNRPKSSIENTASNSPAVSNIHEFEWESFKYNLDKIFFYDGGIIRRGSQEHFDFWNFVSKYLAFLRKQAKSGKPSSQNEEERRQSKNSSETTHNLDIPRTYDVSHKLNFILKIDRDPTAIADMQGKRELTQLYMSIYFKRQICLYNAMCMAKLL